MHSKLKNSILLVEDEILIARLEKKILEVNGYRVVTAQSGESALEIIQLEDFDMVLMDINLGVGLDGTEVAREILKTHNIPIVFLSSHTDPKIVNKTKEITSYGYVVKNTGETVLIASIEMAFKLFEAHKKIQESENKYRYIFNNLYDGIYTSKMGKFIEVNTTMLKIFGYTYDEMIGMDAWKLARPELQEKTRDTFFEITSQKQSGIIEIECLTKAKREIIVETNFVRTTEEVLFLVLSETLPTEKNWKMI